MSTDVIAALVPQISLVLGSVGWAASSEAARVLPVLWRRYIAELGVQRGVVNRLLPSLCVGNLSWPAGVKRDAGDAGTLGQPMTTEQAEAFAQLRTLAAPARLRVRPDTEGWPVIPGRLGQIEWYCNGQDCHHGCPLPGEFALAVYTDRPRLFPKLWALPGVRRWQTGDREMRAVFPPEALTLLAGVIRARRRRTLSPEGARRLGAQTAYRATSRRQDRTEAGTPAPG